MAITYTIQKFIIANVHSDKNFVEEKVSSIFFSRTTKKLHSSAKKIAPEAWNVHRKC